MSTKLFENDYFEHRQLNDLKRIKSFNEESDWMKANHVPFNGVVCDVGCSTGEFLDHIHWLGPKYGMEVNELAISIATKTGVSFSKNILNVENFFDVIIFRGTIQHLDKPFQYIEASFKSLKPGGFVVFLATPNIESIYYRIFNSLPALETKRSFFLPGSKHLLNLCNRAGFECLNVEYPYYKSGYDRPFLDGAFFLARLFSFSNRWSAPFPKNMMNILLRRPFE
jgi:2-polyprenyl-3-methyl-5-hydroxy-6-metoxy-1,4-benzoquinol methylase